MDFDTGPSESQLETAITKFQFHQNTDGVISIEKLGKTLMDSGLTLPTFMLTELIIKFQKELANGEIDQSLFLKIFKQAAVQQPTEDILINCIKSMCPPGETSVPSHIMRELLTKFGDQLTNEEFDEFLADCDEFGTGTLDPELVANTLITGPKT